jgi:rSAM/selenodomain-associated transferase 1
MSAESTLCLVVFARAPIPGAAKTRLVPALGTEGAARLQQRMTEHILAATRAAALGPVALWCAPSADHPFFAACRERFGVSLHTQPDGGLGERLRAAHDAAFQHHDGLLVIGTDCPILDAGRLQEAAADLEDSEAVLVPAEDGGYVLLGLRRPCASAFDGIDWGGERVAAQTRERLHAAGVCCRVRQPLWDVDRPEDLARLQRELPHLAAGLRARS